MNDSICSKNYLCDFRKEAEHHDALVERCQNCGKKVVYQKHNGNIDEDKYRTDHRRMILQPGMQFFQEIYGHLQKRNEETLRKFYERKITKEESAKAREELWERRVFLRQRAFKGSGMSKKEIIQTIPKRIRKTGRQ